MEDYSELNGYKDLENQQKADDVRKLVNRGMKIKDRKQSKRILNEAEMLSFSLATYLKEKYPEHQFTIIMGSDSYQNIERWKNYQFLLDNYDIYVYNRDIARFHSEWRSPLIISK